MYQDKSVSIAALYLDPNNPRLSVKTELLEDVSDSEIESVQVELRKKFTDGSDREGGFDISDLLDSISKMGYQGIDQIVVRPIEKKRGKFVVLEGNRRVASIKYLLEKDTAKTVHENRGEHNQLHEDVLHTLKKINVLVLETEGVNEEDLQNRINLILGIRHHGSLLAWEPLPRAFNIFSEYMHELSIAKTKEISSELKNFEFLGSARRDVARRLAIKATEVTEFLRSYIAYCQLRDSGYEVKGKHFSLVKALVCNSQLRTHFLPSDKNFFLEQQSLDNLNKVAEFSDRDKSNFVKILDDPKAAKKLKDLVCAQYEAENSESVKGLARSNLVAVQDKTKSLVDAIDEVVAAKKREGWIQAIEDELQKLKREKQPLKFESYPGFGNEREAKDRLWKKVKKLQVLVELDD